MQSTDTFILFTGFSSEIRNKDNTSRLPTKKVLSVDRRKARISLNETNKMLFLKKN